MRLFLILSCLIGVALAVKDIYRDKKISSGDYNIYTVPIYSKDDSPWGSGNPYIKYNLTLSQTIGKEILYSPADIIIYHEKMRDALGRKIDDKRQYCCTSELADKGKCSNVGRLMIDNETFAEHFTSSPIVWEWSTYYFDNTTDTVEAEGVIAVELTGLWRLAIFQCSAKKDKSGQSNGPRLSVKGESVFMNPYGHIPGDIVALLPLSWCLCILYAILGVAWVVLGLRNRGAVGRLQFIIGIVLYISVAHYFIFGVDYVVYNRRGVLSLAFNLIEVFPSASKRTLQWVALAAACHGYGVTVQHLPRRSRTINFTLGLLYGAFEFLYELILALRYSNDPRTDGTPVGLEYFLLTCVSILNFCYVIFVFWGIFTTLNTLRGARAKQGPKVWVMVRLAIVLAITYVVAFAWLLLQVGAYYSNAYDGWWRGWWLLEDGFWWILEIIVTAVIAYMWRPSPHARQYAYDAQVDDDAPGEEAPAPASPKPKKKKGEDSEEDDGIDLPDVTMEEARTRRLQRSK